MALVPLLIAIVMAELSEGGIDAKAIALMGILAACFSALRIASPGIDGFEPEWFLLILSARVFGRGFGFVLGAIALFASALVTGGVGPWLPFQMLAAAWIGFGAGCLPPARGSAERVLLAGVRCRGRAGLRAAHQLLVLALRRLGHELLVRARCRGGVEPAPIPFFDITTSLGFDLTRAVTCVVLILVLGRPVLAALRRASRRAVFEPAPEFVEQSG